MTVAWIVTIAFITPSAIGAGNHLHGHAVSLGCVPLPAVTETVPSSRAAGDRSHGRCANGRNAIVGEVGHERLDKSPREREPAEDRATYDPSRSLFDGAFAL